MKLFLLDTTVGFFEGLPIIDIIKAGAAGLAVLVAILAYKITKQVVSGSADPIKAGLAKFSWVASLVLVSIMVAAELLRFIHPNPTLGIQTSGWNERDFAGPLKLRIWDTKYLDTALGSDTFEYVIRGTSPQMTINLDGTAKKIDTQTAVAAKLTDALGKAVTPQGTAARPADTGPAINP
jgi:hypothetical protein